MPIKHTYIDNTLTNPVIEEAYSVVSEFHFNLDKKLIVFSYDVYRNEEAYDNRRDKIGTVVIKIDDARQDAVYSAAPIIDPGTPDVLDDNGNIVTPGTPAVYGEPVLIKAAIPSFNDVILTNVPVYVNLAKAIYDVALTQSTIFKDGVFIAPSAYELR